MADALAPYSKVSLESNDSALSALDLFAVPDTHTSVTKGGYVEVYPIDGNNKEGPVEFKIEGSQELYIDLKNTYLELMVQVLKHDGSAFGDDLAGLKCSLGDNFFHTVFEKATVRLAEQDVEYRSAYAYDAFLQQLTENTKEIKDTVLASTSGWMENGGVGKTWATLTDDEKVVRKEFVNKSPVLSYFGKPLLSFFEMDRFIPPGVSVGLRLDRSTPKFSLLMGEDPAQPPKVHVKKAVLHVRKCEVNTSVRKVHTALLAQGEKVKYPITRKKGRFHILQKGVTEANINIDQKSQLPNSVLIAMFPLDSKTGAWQKNPFTAKHYKLNYIEYSIGGVAQGPRYKPNFETGDVARTYAGFMEALNKFSDISSCGLGVKEWSSGKTIFGFNITPELCGEAFHLIQQASVVLKLQFADQLPENVAVYVLELRDDLIEMNMEREVTMIQNLL